MTHPITPPPELVQQWVDQLLPQGSMKAFNVAAQWGADQELEACCGALDELNGGFWSEKLRAARRPKPPSLKDEALEALVSINSNFHVYGSDIETIRRALEALND